MRPAWTSRHQVAAGAVTRSGRTTTVTVVPQPGRELTSRRPPTSSARSVMLRSPYDPPRPPGPGGLGGEAAAVVGNAQERVPAVAGQPDLDPAGLRVLDSVLQRLPGGAVQRDLHVLGELAFGGVHPDIELPDRTGQAGQPIG